MNFTINSTKNMLSNTGGIALAGKIFQNIGLGFEADPVLNNPEKSILSTLAGLLIQGRSSFAETDLVRNDLLFQKSLDLGYVYAPETIRIYLERMVSNHRDHVLSLLNKSNQKLLKEVSLSPISTESGKYLPVDIDVSPMDNSRTKKEGVSRTYKGFDGYAPIFSYIGTEGFMLSCELRPGSQHCQKGTPEYLRQTLKMVKEIKSSDPVLFRLDSGNDSFDTLAPLMKSGHYFLIKKNLRRESRERWLEIARSMGESSMPREGKIVYTGVLTGQHPKAPEKSGLPDLDQVFRVTIRNIDRDGNFTLFPIPEVEVYWTNLYESPEKVIELYHSHGTSEQFHSELKSDMNFERFPSGKQDVNAVLLHIAMIAFNTLRKIGQLAISFTSDLPYKHSGERKRLRKVIDDLIRVACQLVHHAHKWSIHLWENDPWYQVFQKVFQTL